MANQLSIKEPASTLKELEEGVANLSAAVDTLREIQATIATRASKHWILPFWEHSKGSLFQ